MRFDLSIRSAFATACAAALVASLALGQAPGAWRPLPSPMPEDENEGSVAIHVKRAITVSGEAIDDATILVRGGKIVAIGKIVDVPKGVERLELGNFIATPGLVVAASRAGLAPRVPLAGAASKTKDALDVDAELMRRAMAAGITSVGLVPPAATGIGPQVSVVRTRGKTIDERVIKEDALLSSAFEMTTGGKDAFRNAFTQAKDASEAFEKAKKEAAEKPASAPAAPPASAPASGPATAAAAPPKPPAPPKLDPRFEPVLAVLKREKKLLVAFPQGGGFFGSQTSPAAEVLHFHDATKRWDFDRIYWGGANLALVADRIVALRGSVLLAADENAVEPFTRNRLNAALELRAAGVKVALLPLNDSREAYDNFLYKVGQLVKNGFPEAEALRAVTLTPAEMLGVEGRVGSLAAGRDADILFFDGAPLEPATKLRRVMVAGELVPEEEMP